MNLAQNYKILPFPITCDTIFLTFSPYYNIKLQQITEFQQILPFLQTIQNQYKIVILAQTYSQGTNIINSITEARQQKNMYSKRSSMFQDANKVASLENDSSNDKLSFLLNQMISKTENKRSLLHVRGLLNQIQTKIQRLDRQIGNADREKQKKDHFNVKKISKKIKKSVKNQQRRMQQLKNKRGVLRRELQQKQINASYLKELASQQQINKLRQQQKVEDQWLLYNQQQSKQNNINI